MKKIIVSFCLSVSVISAIFAQDDIKMSFSAELTDHRGGINPSYIRYDFNAKQTIKLNNYDNDTLMLFMKKPLFGINKLRVNAYYPELNVKIKSANEQECKNAYFDFDGRVMKIETQKKDCEIQIEYTTYNNFFLHTDSLKMLAFISPYISHKISWYFSPNYDDTIRFENLTLKVPENTYFFATCPYEKQGQQYILNTKETQDKDVSFFLLEKDYYEKYEIKPNINVFFSRGVFADFKNKTRIPLDSLDKKIVDNRINIVKNAVEKIENIFENNNDYIIDIADAYRNRGKFFEGNVYRTSDNSSFGFIDTAFWNISSFIHEFIHCYTPYAKDSSGYFFQESMTEYIAQYIYYEDAAERDKVFTDRMLIFSRHKDIVNKSIFELDDNYTNMKLGYGTSSIIYEKIPFIIHTLAKRVGEDKFINILKQFYKQAKEKGRTDFRDFENIIKSNEVTERDWRLFRDAL
ncbi:MAG: hypothetical protein LBQ28_02010 [Prevotellaceae bacterium]|jgi:hypothetical protein|nr:hypothetical protein [Prevotellaceae bacterium]